MSPSTAPLNLPELSLLRLEPSRFETSNDSLEPDHRLFPNHP